MILDMQYTLATQCGIPPDLNMRSKELLYFYSCWCKDKQREKELRNASRNKGKMRIPVSAPRKR